MSAPSLFQLVEIIREVVTSHPAQLSFACNERNAISLAGDTPPIHVHLEQPFVKQVLLPRGGSKTVVHDLKLLVLDIPAVMNDLETLRAISRCDMIANWIVLRLIEHPPAHLQVSSNVNILSLREFGGDQWAGVRMEFSITTGMPMGACDVRYYEP